MAKSFEELFQFKDGLENNVLKNGEWRYEPHNSILTIKDYNGNIKQYANGFFVLFAMSK